MKVAFIGLGRMGSAMARRVLDAKHEVALYNRTPGKAQELASAGAKAVSTIKDAATFGDAVFTMLADDAALRDVVNQSGGHIAVSLMLSCRGCVTRGSSTGLRCR